MLPRIGQGKVQGRIQRRAKRSHVKLVTKKKRKQKVVKLPFATEPKKFSYKRKGCLHSMTADFDFESFMKADKKLFQKPPEAKEINLLPQSLLYNQEE